jgi:NFU1 iron-sulfur cluster scaffold homolog, mitochondrial
MAVSISQTPNPNALKFTVGETFDEPKSFAAGMDTDDPVAAPLLEIPGITSVFMSADFVTISKSPDAYWDEIAPEAARILETHFGD